MNLLPVSQVAHLAFVFSSQKFTLPPLSRYLPIKTGCLEKTGTNALENVRV